MKARDANDILRERGEDALRLAWDKAHEEATNRTTHDKSTLKNGLRFTCLDRVQPEPVEWLWPLRVARGKLALLTGDPDMGKSQITLDVIARITKGAAWPDEGRAPLGNAIILSSEDGLSDTIRPRLEAAGGDPSRAFCLQSVVVAGKEKSFSLKDDLQRLEACLAEMPDVKIIVIDPITAYMGDKIDSHQTTDVRAVLEPCIALSARTKVAILAITHPTKSAQSKAINAFTGSLAYLAAARIAFIAIREPETDRRLLLAVKNNLGTHAAGLGYDIKETIISDGLAVPHIVWDREPVTITANEAMRALHGGGESKVNEAKKWLAEQLTTGPKPMKGIEKEAKDNGVSEKTLRRAKAELGVVAEKSSFHGDWWWRLAT
jgi:hypothetical protein